MDYTDIDHLLLHVNKGPAVKHPAGASHPGPVRPGDIVVVSTGDRTILNVVIHKTDEHSQTLMGETAGAVRDAEGREIIGEAARVCFSYQKLAGIHRR